MECTHICYLTSYHCSYSSIISVHLWKSVPTCTLAFLFWREEDSATKLHYVMYFTQLPGNTPYLSLILTLPTLGLHRAPFICIHSYNPSLRQAIPHISLILWLHGRRGLLLLPRRGTSPPPSCSHGSRGRWPPRTTT